MSHRDMDDCCKDVINVLPDNLLCQILSNLSTKEAALTSVLSKRWRYLFALVPNLDFDCSDQETMIQDRTSFIDFVDRVLKLRGNDHINKFFLKCGDGFEDEDIFPWISNVLRHGVSELALHVSPSLVYWLPWKIFASKTLVKLKIGPESGPIVKIRSVCLPKLKTLSLDSVVFEESEIGFAKLLSGCPVLEELSLRKLMWYCWDSCYVASKTLKRLTLCCVDYDENPKKVSLDTPNVVYLEYSDNIAQKYPIMNLNSLIEASISIRMTNDQKAVRNILDGEEAEETEMVSNLTMLLMGICNLKTLYLSYDTLEVYTEFCSEAIPVFNNLTHLTIESNPKVGWESLPHMFKNCPNLETLVFKGIIHKATDSCGDVCLCQGFKKSSSCLSSSPVKVIKILQFRETDDDDDDDDDVEMEQIKHFLEKMPNLEQMIVYYNTSSDDNLVIVSNEIQMISQVASLKCKIRIVSTNLSLSMSMYV